MGQAVVLTSFLNDDLQGTVPPSVPLVPPAIAQGAWLVSMEAIEMTTNPRT